MTMKLAHVSIRCQDIQVSKAFYVDLLGLESIRDVEDERLKFSFVQAGDSVIELLESKVDDNERLHAGAVDHVAFFVTDIQAEIERLKKAGVTFTMEETRDILEYRIIFLLGPSGEKIELMEIVK